MLNLIKVGLSSLVIAGSMFVVTPAQAVTEHCDTATFPNKVEVGGDDATVYTGLRGATEVCLKVGTKVTYVFVDSDGNVTNTAIVNQNGKAQGISYYAWGDENPS